MKHYHYRFLDRSNRTCQAPMIASCSDDKAAVDAAARLLGGCFVEVWEFERFVARVEPSATPHRSNKRVAATPY